MLAVLSPRLHSSPLPVTLVNSGVSEGCNQGGATSLLSGNLQSLSASWPRTEMDSPTSTSPFLCPQTRSGPLLLEFRRSGGLNSPWSAGLGLGLFLSTKVKVPPLQPHSHEGPAKEETASHPCPFSNLYLGGGCLFSVRRTRGSQAS